MDQTVAEKAQRALTDARHAQQRGDREQAIVLLDQGIALLGNDYLKGHRRGALIDDSDQKLMASHFEQADGRLDVAIALRSGVLEGRLQLYTEGHCPPAGTTEPR